MYYLDRDLDLRGRRQDFNLQIGPNGQFSIAGNYTEKTEVISGFTQGSWHITDTVSATLGVRRSLEEKSAKSVLTVTDFQTRNASNDPLLLKLAADSGVTPFDFDTQTRKEGSTDGTVSIQWAVNDDINMYFTHARATKGGGYNSTLSGDRIDEFEFDEEKARNWEVGVKTELLDRRMRLNA